MNGLLTVLAAVLWGQWLLPVVEGHGRLMEPPSRSSMWRQGYDTPVNYNDNQLFCGGVGVQYSPSVGGKCGVCGDPWPGPRDNEAGGIYATGKIVRQYDVGQVINVTVYLTANHKGYFEFRLCAKDDPFEKATWDCMNKNVLTLESNNQTRYEVHPNGYMPTFRTTVRLPQKVKCRACVFQWKYNAGNSWGKDEDGRECVGCGRQEQFYGCSDVSIGYKDSKCAKTGNESSKLISTSARFMSMLLGVYLMNINYM